VNQSNKFLSPLARDFFNRDPRVVSEKLLGKILVRRERRTMLTGRIVEVEAYLGSGDAAAHSAAGCTARNSVLFGPPGHAYVYFIYGNHYCLNVSCLPDGEAGCILIRALEPRLGIKEMARKRGLAEDIAANTTGKISTHLRALTNGPGKLAQAFGITRERDNGKDMTSRESDLFIAEDGFAPPKIQVTPRIGITKSAEQPLRYIIAGNEFVSRKVLTQRRG